ncbi:MAG TPA: hypothetical protein V6D26_12050 [Stenomitos sp.]
MIYMDMPVIIPLLATGYLLTIYLLLTLAQRTIKNSRYVDNSVTDAYAPFGSTEQTAQTEEVEAWSFQVSGLTSLAPDELTPPVVPVSNVQKASRVS